MTYPPGATSRSIDVLIVDDVGIPVTGLVAATFPAVLYSIAGANADVALGSLSDLALITTTWAAKGVKERAGGRYRLDLPDAVFASAGKVTLWAEASGTRLLCEVIEVMDVATQTTLAVVKAKTDQLTFTSVGVVDTNVAAINNSAASAGFLFQYLDDWSNGFINATANANVLQWQSVNVGLDAFNNPLVAFARVSSTTGSFAFAATGTVNLDTLATAPPTAAAIWAAATRTLTSPTNFGSLSIDSNGRVKIQSGVTKNAAIAGFEFFMADAADHVTGKTGLTVTATRSLDGAAFGACANAVAEVSGGLYKIDLAAADLNGATVTLRFVATGADTRVVEVLPTP